VCFSQTGWVPWREVDEKSLREGLRAAGLGEGIEEESSGTGL